MRVTATVVEGHNIDEVADRLSRSGMRVDQKLTEIGIVIGDAADDCLELLSKLEGVVSVEPEGHFQLPPPDSSPQ